VNVAENVEQPAPVGENDIVFECPHCGKSLAIEERGAGMVIVCPDCQARVQVPGPFNETAVLAPDIPSPSESSRPRDSSGHFEEIGKELGLIQAAMDRIVGILQEASDENAPRR
jgi:DNA-directed RNA polymerase subunit RPC12/RpoP